MYAGRPVLSDRTESGVLLTRDGDVAGPPAYMSPEQARGEVARLSEATDTYALGGILYHLLTGASPVEGDDPIEALAERSARRGRPGLRRDGASSGSRQSSFCRSRQKERNEEPRGVEVVLARFIDHSDIAVYGGSLVGKDLVELAVLEIHVAFRVDA